MSRTIWKYPVPLTDRFSLDIPRGYIFLDVQVQYDGVMLWTLVDTEAAKEPVRFAVIGTGNPYPDEDEGEFWHIGTFQIHGGALVFHLFYRNPWAE